MGGVSGNDSALNAPTPPLPLRGREYPAIRMVNHPLQLWGRKRIPHERGQDRKRQFGIGKPRHRRNVGRRKLRQGFRHIQPAVARQPGKQRPAKINLRRRAACGKVVHETVLADAARFVEPRSVTVLSFTKHCLSRH